MSRPLTTTGVVTRGPSIIEEDTQLAAASRPPSGSSSPLMKIARPCREALSSSPHVEETSMSPQSAVGRKRRPTSIIVDGKRVPLDRCVKNSAIRMYLKKVDEEEQQGGGLVLVPPLRACRVSEPHNISRCLHIHWDTFTLVDGSTVDGVDLVRNVGLRTLRENSGFVGCYCANTRSHDVDTCPFLHRKMF